MYLKITNKEEKHYGMQYKTGINTDIIPFNPTGNCKPGGIYFTTVENVFAFLNYGEWVREVTIPDNEEIYENPGTPKKWKANKVILGEKKPLWNVDTFQWLIDNGANIHADNDGALRYAAENGHLEIVKYLVECGANINAEDDSALRFAAYNGHLEIVKWLVDNGANIHANDDWPLLYAAQNGHLEIVKILVENGANIHANDDCALQYAAYNGHLAVVDFLKTYGTK